MRTLSSTIARWLNPHKVNAMNYPADTWTITFEQAYQKTLEAVRAGKKTASEAVPADCLPFLATIGCTAQELFDFADDAVKYGEPDYGTTLLITAVRRDYFLQVQRGIPSTHTASMNDLPAKTDQVDGIEWLPRLIEKARLKLRGEMPADLMYGCGGDRKFFRQYQIHPADFLHVTWAAGDNNTRIVEYVKSRLPQPKAV